MGLVTRLHAAVESSPVEYCRDCDARTPTVTVGSGETDTLGMALCDRRCVICGHEIRKETIG